MFREYLGRRVTAKLFFENKAVRSYDRKILILTLIQTVTLLHTSILYERENNIVIVWTNFKRDENLLEEFLFEKSNTLARKNYSYILRDT